MSAYDLLVSGYFWFGAAWSALTLSAILLTRHRFAGSAGETAPQATRPSRWGAIACAAVVFCVALVARLSVVDRILDASFVYIVEAMDSCIAPFQQKLGLREWGADLVNHATNAIVSSFAMASHDAFGFEPRTLRSLHALSFSIGAAYFAHALFRAFGAGVASVVAGILVVSFPFLLHSLWATAMGAAALPSLVYFGLLIGGERISSPVAVAAGAILGASPLIYPGATIAMACFLAFQIALQRERWSVLPLGCLAASALATKWALDWGYDTPLTRIPDAGGFLTTQYVADALRVIPQDFFHRSTSFASMNFGGPYFEPVLLWALALALLRPTRVFWLCLGVCVLGTVLSAFTGPYPGVRRVLWTLPLLYLGCVHAVFQGVQRQPRVATVVGGAFAVSLALLGARDVVIGSRHFPLFPPDSFYTEAANFLRERAPIDAEVVLLEEGMFGAKHYWCALGFTKALWPPDRAPLLLPKGKPRAVADASESWVLMQPDDSIPDLQRVFGDAELEPLYPRGSVQSARPSAQSKLRVVRVRRPVASP